MEPFRISGSFRTKRFDVEISGRTLAPRKPMELLQKSGASLFDCTGSGIVYRNATGGLSLEPMGSAKSGGSRSPIPAEADHRFRGKPITYSGMPITDSGVIDQ